MRTKVIYANGGQICEHADGRITNQTEYHILSTDPKPIEGVNNAAQLIYMDWKSLTEAEQSALGARIWEFDAENKKWHPM